jgi:hypothetical protein
MCELRRETACFHPVEHVKTTGTRPPRSHRCPSPERVLAPGLADATRSDCRLTGAPALNYSVMIPKLIVHLEKRRQERPLNQRLSTIPHPVPEQATALHG